MATWSFAADASTGRPLYNNYGPYNAVDPPNELVAEGIAGDLSRLPVVEDANIPTTCATGALTGGTGDMIGVVREDDMVLFEETLRMRAMPEVLSGSLMFRLQTNAYFRFCSASLPASTTLITGSTGLAAASF